MPKLDKKQRHKAKRDAKRREIRLRESVSPIKRLAEASGEIECWASDHFEENGQIQLFVYKRAAGLNGVACFLVDRGVVGLKDAWCRVGMGRSEFQDMLDQCDIPGISMLRITLEEARRWVAGGVRWAHDNGMCLPKDWIRTASIIGGVGDWKSADVTKFVKEFAGHPDDLRRRLIGEPYESYIQRTDIAFVFSATATYLDQRTGKYANGASELDEEDAPSLLAGLSDDQLDEVMARMLPLAAGLVEGTIAWLEEQGERPSEHLVDAWRFMVMALVFSKLAIPDAPDDEKAAFEGKLMMEFSGWIEAHCLSDYYLGVDQAQRHLRSNPLIIPLTLEKYGLVDDAEADKETAGENV